MAVRRAKKSAKVSQSSESTVRAFVDVPGRYAGSVMGLMAHVLEPGGDAVADTIEALRERIGRPPTGVIVTNVAPNSRAAKAGMKRGDILLKYDGTEIDKSETLKSLAEGASQSKKVAIEGNRGADRLRLTAQGGRLGITVAGFADAAQTRN